MYKSTLGFILLLAMGLRCAAAGNDLWLDEIWSLQSVAGLHSVWGVFTSIHSDNNHYLNSSYLFWLGEGARSPWLARAPAIAMGMLTVLGATYLGLRQTSQGGALCYPLVFAVGYPLVHYSTEARGYSGLILATVLSYDRARVCVSTDTHRARFQLALVALLGLASHLTYLHVLAGLAAWLGLEFWRRRRATGDYLRDMAQVFLAPLVLLGVLWWIDLRRMQYGGGNPKSSLEAAWESAGWFWFGSGWGPVCSLGVVLSLLVLGISLGRRSVDERLFFVLAILVAPPATLLFGQVDFVHPRYFLVALTLLALLWAECLASAPRPIAVIGLLIYSATNLGADLRLIERGRGRYREALQWICDQSRDNPVTMTGDHDFRNLTTISFYAPTLNRPKNLSYVPRAAWAKSSPQWLLTQSFEERPQARPTLYLEGHPYRFQRLFPSVALSGWSWLVYKRD